MKILGILLFFAIYSVTECQVHYVPVQMLIPTLNGSVATNHSIYSSNNVLPVIQPVNNRTNISNNGPTNYYTNNINSYGSIYNGSRDGHLFLGNISAFDRCLFSQEYYKPRKWYTNREKIIEYPKDLPAGYSRHEIISAIRIYNKFYDGNTARARVLEGGIGRQYVKIELKSNWGNGFRYLVQLFGR